MGKADGSSGRTVSKSPSVAIGNESLSVGSVVRLVPAKGDDRNAFGRVVEVNAERRAVRVEAYRGKRALPKDSGWYQVGRGLYRDISGGAYLAGYNRRGLERMR